VKAAVVSAIPLADKALEQLKARLQSATGKEVYLQSRLDPTILGGLVAQVGGTIYDGSLKTQLRRMREQLLKG
jgi:F-type H+-transporting ATPase subunit delta